MNKPVLYYKYDSNMKENVEYTINKPYFICNCEDYHHVEIYRLSNYTPIAKLEGKTIALLLEGGLKAIGTLKIKNTTSRWGQKHVDLPYVAVETNIGIENVVLKEDYVIQILD